MPAAHRRFAPRLAGPLALVLLAAPFAARAQAPDEAAGGAPAAAQGGAPPPDIGGEPSMPELKFETGTVKIGTVAEAALPPTFQFLGPSGAQFVVSKLWGNPPDPSILGLILPVVDGEPSPAWGVVLTYNDDGHVDDGDAAELDYDEILKGMQDDMPAINEARKKQGLGTFQLVGWATSPAYDAATHRIHWAKRLKPDDFPDTTINDDIRVLGRAGYLEVSAVGAEADLPAIEAGMKVLLDTVHFVDGQRYEQYSSGMDKAAAYGIGALVAGKVAAKIGLFAGLLKYLIVFKKFVIVGVAALGAGVARLLGRRKARNDGTGGPA